MLRPTGSVFALNQVHAAFRQLSVTSLRLTTSQRVHSGRDNPEALIASELIRDELASLEAATRNTARASSVVQIADNGLSQIGDLLSSVRANVVSAGNSALSTAEREALQLETDAALEAVDRIASYTSYGDTKLLDGTNAELTFALSGDPSNKATLELPQVSTATLGDDVGALSELASGGAANLVDGDLTRAASILDAARDEILQARANLGAFETYTVDTTSRVIETTTENLTGSLGQMIDVNAAEETSNLLRAQILAETSLAALHVANNRSSLVQSLFNWLGQRD